MKNILTVDNHFFTNDNTVISMKLDHNRKKYQLHIIVKNFVPVETFNTISFLESLQLNIKKYFQFDQNLMFVQREIHFSANTLQELANNIKAAHLAALETEPSGIEEYVTAEILAADHPLVIV